MPAYQGNKPYIFLNYSHRDKELADYVVDYLQEYNFNVWYDEGIPSGTRWENVMIDKITNCSVMVFLVTKNSLASDWCKQELRFAKEEGKKFINVVIGSPQLPVWFIYDFHEYQRLDEKNFPNRKAMMDKLVEDLLYHELNPNKPKETTKETSVAKPLPTAKAPWVCKSCGSNNSGDDDVCEVCGSSGRYVAPTDTPAPSPTEGLEFSIIVDGTARVDRYKGTDSNVIIPASIIRNGKSYKVTSIGACAFYDCKNLTSITIPDGITSIGLWAFNNCKNLTSITIPNSVISIDNQAFETCSSLTSIVVDKNNQNYKSIDGNLYSKDGSTLIQYAAGKTATAFTIPDSVTSIGIEAFAYCTSLTTVTIPDSVTSICEIAFCNCKNLTSITIPNSVTIIEPGAFVYCENLTIYCEAKSKPRKWHIGWNSHNRPVVWRCKSSKRSVAPKGPLKLISAKGLKFTIVDDTTKVTSYAGTKTKVIIPTTITRKRKFYKVTAIGAWAFYWCTKLTSITIPNSVTSIGDYAFKGCENLSSITIPNSVTTIGKEAFFYCENLTSITIPNSVTSIGVRAFWGCSSLISITIPDGVTSIGESAFSLCENLTSVTIPDSVTSIGEKSFCNCENLTSISIPNSVTSIGESAFGDCENITSIDVDENNTHYKSIDGNLYSKDGTILIQYAIGKTDTTFTIPDHVTIIGKEAFANCTNLTSITIPNSVTSIDNWAFVGCTSLTIYCEKKSKPYEWSSLWNSSNCAVIWGHKIK